MKPSTPPIFSGLRSPRGERGGSFVRIPGGGCDEFLNGIFQCCHVGGTLVYYIYTCCIDWNISIPLTSFDSIESARYANFVPRGPAAFAQLAVSSQQLHLSSLPTISELHHIFFQHIQGQEKMLHPKKTARSEDCIERLWDTSCLFGWSWVDWSGTPSMQLFKDFSWGVFALFSNERSWVVDYKGSFFWFSAKSNFRQILKSQIV